MIGNTEYFESEDFKEILRQYEESVKLGEHIYMDADDLADIADYYRCNNRKEEARAAIALAMEYNPEAVGPMLFRAREAIEAKDYETVDSLVEKIEPLDPLEGIYLRAELLILRNDIEGADNMLSDYFKDNVPDDEKTDFVTGVLNLYLDYNMYLPAFNWVKRCISEQNFAQFKEIMAHILYGIGNYNDSEKLFNELIDDNPYFDDYWTGMAKTQYMKEDYSSSLNSSEYALAINPDNSEGLLTKANALFALANYDEALEYYEKYSEKEQDDEYGYFQQALCLINKDMHNDALPLLQKAVSVSPVDSEYLVDIYFEMAQVYSKLGDLDKALWCLNMTDHLKCHHAHFEVMKGHLYLEHDKEQEAKEKFDEALKMSKNDKVIQLQIIVSYLDNSYLDYAYKSFVDFFNNVDDKWDVGYSYMALCCNDLAKKEEFLHYLKKACDVNPEEAQSLLFDIFPEDMDVKDYYDYALKHFKDK